MDFIFSNVSSKHCENFNCYVYCQNTSNTLHDLWYSRIPFQNNITPPPKKKKKKKKKKQAEFYLHDNAINYIQLHILKEKSLETMSYI